jgi:hypothetical protein
MPDKPRPLALAGIAVVVVTAVTIGSVIVRETVLPMVPRAVVAAALLLLVAWPVLDRAGRWALGSRGRVVSMLTVGGASGPIVLGALFSMADPVVDAHRFRCGTGEMALMMFSPFVLMLATALTALLSVVAAGGTSDVLVRRMRWLAGAALTVSVALVAASLARAARFPDPDHYVASLPVIGRVTAASGEPVAIKPLVPSKAPSPATPAGEARLYDDRIGSVVLRRRCVPDGCDVTLVGAAPPELREWGMSYDRVPPTEPIEVRRDEPHDIWVVEGHLTRPYVGPQLVLQDVTVRDVADRLSPPRGWLAGAALGLGLAGALLLLRRRAARELRAIEAGRPGVLEASGLVRFADGDAPVRVAAGQALVEGPVVVLPGALVSGSVYRGDAPQGGARVACGDRDDLVARAKVRLAGLDALAFAACALTGAPLVASAIVGLVL